MDHPSSKHFRQMSGRPQSKAGPPKPRSSFPEKPIKKEDLANDIRPPSSQDSLQPLAHQKTRPMKQRGKETIKQGSPSRNPGCPCPDKQQDALRSQDAQKTLKTSFNDASGKKHPVAREAVDPRIFFRAYHIFSCNATLVTAPPELACNFVTLA